MDLGFSDPRGNAPSRHFPELSRNEVNAMMLAFLIGRQTGNIAKFGALGQLVQRLSPDGALQQIAEVLVDTAAGRYETAVSRLQVTPLKGRKQVSERNSTIEQIKVLSRLRPGSRKV